MTYLKCCVCHQDVLDAPGYVCGACQKELINEEFIDSLVDRLLEEEEENEDG
jgi:hypothetical protein